SRPASRLRATSRTPAALRAPALRAPALRAPVLRASVLRTGVLRTTSLRAAAILTAALLAAPLASAVTSTWGGGTGVWSDATRWSTNPLFPCNGQGGNTYDVVLGSGTATLD